MWPNTADATAATTSHVKDASSVGAVGDGSSRTLRDPELVSNSEGINGIRELSSGELVASEPPEDWKRQRTMLIQTIQQRDRDLVASNATIQVLQAELQATRSQLQVFTSAIEGMGWRPPNATSAAPSSSQHHQSTLSAANLASLASLAQALPKQHPSGAGSYHGQGSSHSAPPAAPASFPGTRRANHGPPSYSNGSSGTGNGGGVNAGGGVANTVPDVAPASGLALLPTPPAALVHHKHITAASFVSALSAASQASYGSNDSHSPPQSLEASSLQSHSTMTNSLAGSSSAASLGGGGNPFAPPSLPQNLPHHLPSHHQQYPRQQQQQQQPLHQQHQPLYQQQQQHQQQSHQQHRANYDSQTGQQAPRAPSSHTSSGATGNTVMTNLAPNSTSYRPSNPPKAASNRGGRSSRHGSKNKPRSQRSGASSSTSSNSGRVTLWEGETETVPEFNPGQFADVGFLGEGSIGIVRLVQHVETGQGFALKVMRKANLIRCCQVDNIRNEKFILSQANSPFIIKIYGQKQTERHVLLLLEHVPGGEVFGYLRAAKVFQPDVARFYAAEVLLAIEHLHSQHILYRDIKPENILLDAEGHIKLVDFGFGKVCHDRTYTFCGTPEYIAPEVVLTRGHGPSADWWAFGVLIYEFLVGKPPFSQEDPMRLYQAIAKADYTCPPHIPADAKDLINGLLQLDVSRRLGCLANGVEDIKRHPFFAPVDWDLLAARKVPTPIRPSPNWASNQSHHAQQGPDPFAEF